MDKKRAQSEIITTVLIILLVLAAIVIVWQVVQGTIKAGGKGISEQNKCYGLDFSIQQLDKGVAGGANEKWLIKRSFSGSKFNDVSIVVVQNGVKISPLNTNVGDLEDTLGTGTFELPGESTTNLEVGIVGDGAPCPITAKWP